MKCDRRWWNDGRLEREKAARMEHTLCLPAWQTDVPSNEWVASMDAHIRASTEDCWRKLMEGDPNGRPWHEVLAAWAPEPEPNTRSFFGVPDLRNTIICGNQELFARALERAGVRKSAEPGQPYVGVPIIEDQWMPRNKAVFIDAHGKFTWAEFEVDDA